MISPQEALAIIARATPVLPPERTALAGAAGRTLARALLARDDFPPFDTTAMDGYAVSTPPGPAPYRELPGVVAAGQKPPGPLPADAALRVMTGAPVPPNAWAVVPVEDVRREGGGISTARTPAEGEHLRRRGEVYRAGDALLEGGELLTPERILLCATAGEDPVEVRRLPRALVAPTGGELVPPDRQPGPGQIRNGNAFALAAALARRGLPARTAPPVPDEEEALAALFSREDHDLLLTTGGVSAGDFDVCVPAARRAGFEILFHKVAVKPGYPVAFGRRGETLWFGLPGNPVSALTLFDLFVASALARFEGRETSRPVLAELEEEVRGRGNREEYRDARLAIRGGRLTVRPLATRGSHDVRAAAGRNALLVLPPGAATHPRGTTVEVLPLELPSAVEPPRNG